MLSLIYVLIGSDLDQSKFYDSKYIIDESGNIFMNINIIGHVKQPGTYLISEKSDILSVLSKAGGALPGAKLNKVALINIDGEKQEINLNRYLNSRLLENLYEINFKPNDTIYIKQTVGSYLFSNTSLINSFLQLVNIYISINDWFK